jgi:hypothetical protein
MLEAQLRKEIDEPPALLVTAVEQICGAMSASGAVVAVCDSEGVRCLASTGDAPTVGSRLQPDSEFTRQCLETGAVVLCQDARNDSRIRPSVAKTLHLGSAVAVPIHAQGSVVGVIEVFSYKPSAIYATDVDVLKQLANLFAPIIAPGVNWETQPHVDETIILSDYAGKEALARSEQQTLDISNRPSQSGSHDHPESRMDPSRVEHRSVLSDLNPTEFRDSSIASAQLGPSGALSGSSAHFAPKSTETQLWQGRAAALSVLALGFLLLMFLFFHTLHSL